MSQNFFRVSTGQPITAVTADEMQDVDRIAVEDIGLSLLQMMENAGRTLAWHVRDSMASDVIVIAGNGGNGGGGLTCARHLANRAIPVQVVLDRPTDELNGAAAHQAHILDKMDVPITSDIESLADIDEQTTIVDALIGYGISGTVRSPANKYIDWMNGFSGSTISLDVPSGIDATTGETLGEAVTPTRTVTLALPKTGLDAFTGELYLADISIPRTVYDQLDIKYERPFGDSNWIQLEQ